MRFRIAALLAASILAGVLALGGAGPASAVPETNPCPGDVNGDGFIDFADLQAVIHAFDTPSTSADVNQDGSVDYLDLQIVLDNQDECLLDEGAFGPVLKPTGDFLVAVLDGNASQTAKDAVAANH